MANHRGARLTSFGILVAAACLASIGSACKSDGDSDETDAPVVPPIDAQLDAPDVDAPPDAPELDASIDAAAVDASIDADELDASIDAMVDAAIDAGPTCGNQVCETNETTTCVADCPARLVVRNMTSYWINDLYVKACSESAWGVDRLGTGMILIGESFTVDGLAPGCYDVRADASPTMRWERTAVFLVATQTFTWTLN